MCLQKVSHKNFIAALFISQKLEIAQMSINKRINEKTAVYSYNGIIFRKKKKTSLQQNG